MVRDGVLAQLRARTQVRHGQLETAIGWMKAPPSRHGYRAVLEALLGFYEPLEERLEAFPDWSRLGFDLAERAKRGWLVADLRALGLSDDDIAALPRCQALPGVDSFGAALGVAYVLEGATLGGRAITHRLAGPLGLTPETGMRFHGGYGSLVGPRWQAFLALLEREGAGPETRHAAAEAADETFACLHEWLAHRAALT